MTTEDAKWNHIRSICWNGMLMAVCVIILYGCYQLTMRVVRPDMPLTDLLKLVGILLGLPILLVLAIYDKINRETVGIILTAIISFSLGQAIK